MYLKVEITDKGIKCVNASTLSEMCSAITLLVSELYEQLSDEAANLFKFLMKKTFENDVPFMKTTKDAEECLKKAIDSLKDDSCTVEALFNKLKERALKDDQAE